MKQKQIVKQDRYETIVPISPKNVIKMGVKNGSGGLSFLKTAVIVTVVLLGMPGLAKAQFQWGVYSGVNASTLSTLGNLGDDNALKIGFDAGVIAKYRFNDWLAVKSGIDYQQKGEKRDDTKTKNETKTLLNYLVLPVKAEFSASEKAGFKNGQRLFFATGPYFGYLLDAKQTILEKTSDVSGLNEGDFGWAFEIGFEFPVFKTKALQVSMNYDMGFSDVSKNIDIQNKTASLNLGFLF
jgi:hypothetical protein